jgi:hypothetical protein
MNQESVVHYTLLGNLTENHAKINKNLCSGAKIIKTRLEMT